MDLAGAGKKEFSFTSSDEDGFLDSASRVLPPEKWSFFLLEWARALSAYGTPASFVSSTRYDRRAVKFDGTAYPFIYTLSANYAERAALMARQQDYVPKKPLQEYDVRMDFGGCFLCQNVVQAIDSRDNRDVADNVMFDLGIHYILPNRYPAQLGHSLSVPKDHDDLERRVEPRKAEDGKTNIYTPETGRTRGNVMTAEYLDAVMDACDVYHLLALRNHVLDGMSIPGHDHFHLMPEDLPSLCFVNMIFDGRESTPYGKGIYTSSSTPFDTLLIAPERRQDLSKTAVPILERLEQSGEVFTLIYHRGRLLISPRYRHEVNDTFQRIGGGVPIHYLDTEGDQFIADINRLVPMSGQFGWERFIA